MPAVLTDHVREALEELSDIEYQSRVWTGQGGEDEVSSLEECMEQLSDDSGLARDRTAMILKALDGKLSRDA